MDAAAEFCRRTLLWRSSPAPIITAHLPLTFTAPLVSAVSGTLVAPFSGPTRDDYGLIFSDGSRRVASLAAGQTAVTWADPVTASEAASVTRLSYDLPAPAGARVSRLLGWTMNGRDEELVSTDHGERLARSGCGGDAAWSPDLRTLHLTPTQWDAGRAIGVTLALEPIRTAETLPDLLERYAEDIGAGALARLKAQTGREWADGAGAAAGRAQFEAAIHRAAMSVAKGHGRARLRVRAYHF
jgi:hypothetical protein